jgi:hypothetical protein
MHQSRCSASNGAEVRGSPSPMKTFNRKLMPAALAALLGGGCGDLDVPDLDPGLDSLQSNPTRAGVAAEWNMHKRRQAFAARAARH